MSCPYCSPDCGGLGNYQMLDPAQLGGLGQAWGLGAFGSQQQWAQEVAKSNAYRQMVDLMAMKPPKTKLRLAQEYAAEVRKRKPEMLVRKESRGEWK